MEIGPKYNCGGFEEFWYVPLKWKAKKRWEGIHTLSRKKSTDVIRISHVDLNSGWAANAEEVQMTGAFDVHRQSVLVPVNPTREETMPSGMLPPY